MNQSFVLAKREENELEQQTEGNEQCGEQQPEEELVEHEKGPAAVSVASSAVSASDRRIPVEQTSRSALSYLVSLILQPRWRHTRQQLSS